jgi:PAS domain S-box-containing protein
MSIEKTIAVGFVLALVLLVSVGILQYRVAAHLVEATQWVTHTNQVLTQIQLLVSGIKDAESSVRGYVATDDGRFLAGYQGASVESAKRLHELRTLASDNASQQRRLDTLEPLVSRRFDHLAEVLDTFRRGGSQTASEFMRQGEGLVLTERISAVGAEMETEERRLLAQRSAETAAETRRTNTVIFVGSLVAIGVLLGAVLIIRRDIGERKRIEETLRRAGAYNRSLLEASLDPLLTISPDGKITDVNSATALVTGYSREELIGADFSNYFTEPERAREGYRQVFREGRVQNYGLEIRHRDGHITPVRYNASVYRDNDGEIVGVFAAARDITERKQFEEQILRLNSELEDRVAARTIELTATNKELESFTYAVAHDLRAPLRHIQGFSGLLLTEAGSQLNDTAQRYLARIQESVNRMALLLEDLLNLSRMGRQELRLTACGLNSVVEKALNELQPEIKDRQIEWRIGRLPFVECDAGLVKQVFTNLLSNAVKFTGPREKAVIEVDRVTVDGETAVYVRDNGVGFSMKYADKLFGIFQRLHRREDFEGTGVGLATVQRIINKHGGRVWAEAKLDEGATFYFTLGAR